MVPRILATSLAHQSDKRTGGDSKDEGNEGDCSPHCFATSDQPTNSRMGVPWSRTDIGRCRLSRNEVERKSMPKW